MAPTTTTTSVPVSLPSASSLVTDDAVAVDPSPSPDCRDVNCADEVDSTQDEESDGASYDDDDNGQLVCPPDSVLVSQPRTTHVEVDLRRRCCEGQSRRRRRSSSNQPSQSLPSASAHNQSTSAAACQCLPCPATADGDASVDECPAGQVRVLKVEGLPDTPGQCCDVYECVDHGELFATNDVPIQDDALRLRYGASVTDLRLANMYYTKVT